MTRWQRWFNKSFGASRSGALVICVPAFRYNNFVKVHPEVSGLTKLISSAIGAKELASFVLGMFVFK
jgi:hypothetical protein